MDLQILELPEEEAKFTYTRNHLYSYINEADENDENLNNIMSFYVRLLVENNSVLIIRLSSYSEVHLNKTEAFYRASRPSSSERTIFSQNQALPPILRPKRLQARYLPDLTATTISSATTPRRNDSNSKPQKSSRSIIFKRMEAPTLAEHTENYWVKIYLNTVKRSIRMTITPLIEAHFYKNGRLQHELVLNTLVPNGFFYDSLL